MGIGPLKWKDKMVESSLEMVKVLNDYFVSVFTRESLSNIPKMDEEGEKEVLLDIDTTGKKSLGCIAKLVYSV